MKTPESDNGPAQHLLTWADDLPFGFKDLKPGAASNYPKRSGSGTDNLVDCCVNGCSHQMRPRSSRRPHDHCPEHDISISIGRKPCYIYRENWHNLIVGRKLLERLEHKVEQRLNYESSEDAVTWNFFIGLFALGRLKSLFKALSGVEVETEPELYLWGNRITQEGGKFWPQLRDLQRQIEPTKQIKTESDVILRVGGSALVVIEAKFGSPNSLFEKKAKRAGSRGNKARTKTPPSPRTYFQQYERQDAILGPLNHEWIYQQTTGILEQLCRNAAYADQLATGGERVFLVNLVRAEAEPDVERIFGEHLRGERITFRRASWEDLFHGTVNGQSKGAALLGEYMREKTLYFRRAFQLN